MPVILLLAAEVWRRLLRVLECVPVIVTRRVSEESDFAPRSRIG
ncbi:MAG: hypothetical protein ACI9G1_003024, partial [Pirellulaceae bacterium]